MVVLACGSGCEVEVLKVVGKSIGTCGNDIAEAGVYLPVKRADWDEAFFFRCIAPPDVTIVVGAVEDDVAVFVGFEFVAVFVDRVAVGVVVIHLAYGWNNAAERGEDDKCGLA